MNYLRYTDRACPPDQWRWRCKRTGHFIKRNTKGAWLDEIERFNDNNGFELPDDWREQAEHELCMLLPPGFCAYEDGSVPIHDLDTRAKVDVVIAGTNVFADWVAKGMPLVAPEVAEERAKTCAACYAAIELRGCVGCVGFVNLVMDVVGSGHTSSDDILRTKSCAWCKCSALANVWMPVESSEKGVSNEMLAVPINHCWKIREIRALRNL